ncbi:MAG: Uma2 family endonuclease, partial [Prochloron sp. SP5CPC1]|nr:Uma2 family endonuclease [Candidatus Paraprochloron terpiosi SP5CPC1]
YDLPSEEKSGLPDEYHLLQSQLCMATFLPSISRDKVFVASDLNLYYDSNHPQWYKRPDWFAVVGVDRLYEKRSLRLSYVIWQEKVAPSIVIEFLSPSTRNEDLGRSKPKGIQPTKWEVYEKILRIPYYIVFDGITNEIIPFHLTKNGYRLLEVNSSKLWLPTLNIGLGLWLGEYQGCQRQWLRWYDVEGNWIPTETEKEGIARALAQRERGAKKLAQQERDRERMAKKLAQQERDRERGAKELAQQQVQQLLERLRQAGIDPD